MCMPGTAVWVWRCSRSWTYGSAWCWGHTGDRVHAKLEGEHALYCVSLRYHHLHSPDKVHVSVVRVDKLALVGGSDAPLLLSHVLRPAHRCKQQQQRLAAQHRINLHMTLACLAAAGSCNGRAHPCKILPCSMRRNRAAVGLKAVPYSLCRPGSTRWVQ